MKSKNDFRCEDDYKAYLRSYYSGLAMQGLIANNILGTTINGYNSGGIVDIVTTSVFISDALINELNK